MDEIKPDMQMDFLAGLGIDDPRKRKGILMLMQDVDGLKKSMEEAKNSSGALGKSFDASGTIGRTWGDVTDQWKRTATIFGEEILPIVAKLVDGLEGWTNIFSGSTGRGINNLSDDTGISKEQAKKLSGYGFNSSQWMTNDDDVATGKRLLQYSEKLGKEIEKFSGLDDRAKNEEIISLSKQKKLLSDTPEGTTMANMINEGILKLSKGKTPAEKAAVKINEGGDGTDKKTDDTATLTSNAGGLRNLIMNVKITNTFKDSEQANAKRKLSDDLVDAARDAMVTIGV